MTTTIIPTWTLGDRLTKARSLTGLNREEFAKTMGISLATVKRSELGTHPVKRGLVLGWAVACGVDPYWLVTGHEPEEGGAVTTPVSVRYHHNNVAQPTLLIVDRETAAVAA